MTPGDLPIRELGNDCILTVRVSPKASRSAITGLHAGALKIAVNAPPDKGKANAAVMRLLADTLHLPPSRIAIEGPQTSRTKKLRIAGISPGELARLLSPFL